MHLCFLTNCHLLYRSKKHLQHKSGHQKVLFLRILASTFEFFRYHQVPKTILKAFLYLTCLTLKPFVGEIEFSSKFSLKFSVENLCKRVDFPHEPQPRSKYDFSMGSSWLSSIDFFFLHSTHLQHSMLNSACNSPSFCFMVSVRVFESASLLLLDAPAATSGALVVSTFFGGSIKS